MLNKILYIWYIIRVTVLIPFPFILLSLLDRLIGCKDVCYYKLLNVASVKLAKIKHTIVGKNKDFIEKGFILPNHRSWFDFAFDEKIAGGSFISRNIVQYVMLFGGLLQVLENKVIRFSRGSTDRHTLYQKCLNHLSKYNNRIIVYPEGTRMKHTVLNGIEDVKSKIKAGFLKSIYEDNKYPVQIFISTNKEKVFNESKMHISFGEEVKSIIGDPIHPSDYKTFEEFYNKITNDWLELWNTVYGADAKIQ
jgi:1-acyl-sn-glycerol-3-phosphate acyltransferase